MKKTYLKAFLVTTFMFCGLSSFSNDTGRAKNATSSATSLVKPPKDYVDWTFLGNQCIYIELTNNNVTCINSTLMLYPECTTKYYYLFAFGTADDCYDTFGQVPITWKFRLSVSGQVANILAKARWDEY